MRAFSRLLKLNVQDVRRYLREGVTPTIKNLLTICQSLSISPLELLTTSANPLLKGPQFVLEQLPTLPRASGHHVTEEDIRTYRNALEQVLALDDIVLFPALSQIVKKLGCSSATVWRHCADLCQAISALQHRPWTEDTHAMAKQELENALQSSEPVSLNSVCKRIGWDRAVLQRHFPDLCKSIISRYRNRFDYERYHKRILEELARKGPTVSVTELARKLGCSSNSLHGWFPNECVQLSKRYLAERQKGSRDRMQTKLEELEQVIETLHQQNIYPNGLIVRNLLSDPFLLFKPEGRNKWREKLVKLGYSKPDAVKES